MKKPRIFKAVSGEIITPGDKVEIVVRRERRILEDREEISYVTKQGVLGHIDLIRFSIDGIKGFSTFSTNKENHDAIILRKII